jgi:hypothetical protein
MRALDHDRREVDCVAVDERTPVLIAQCALAVVDRL